MHGTRRLARPLAVLKRERRRLKAALAGKAAAKVAAAKVAEAAGSGAKVKVNAPADHPLGLRPVARLDQLLSPRR